MSEHNKFDKYIKGLFDENPKVPSELRWEEMDFDLPGSAKPILAEQKKKNGRKYLSLLLLLLLFFTTCSIILFNNNKGEELKTQAINIPAAGSDSMASSSVLNAKASDVSTNIEEGNVQDKIVSINIVTDIKKSDATLKLPSTLTSEDQNNNQAKAKNSKNNSLKQSASNNLTNIKNDKELDRLLLVNTTKNISAENPKSITSGNTLSNKTSKSKATEDIVELAKTEAHETSNTLPLANVKTEDYAVQKLALKPIIPLVFSESLARPDIKKLFSHQSNSPDENENNNKKIILEEVMIGFGYNNFILDIDESSPLKDYVNNAFGNSYKIGARFGINNKWKTNFQLKFDQYHSTFEYTRDLEPIIDLQAFRQINRMEETYHNNFTNTLGLQISLERRFYISNLFQLYGGLGITPTYVLSSTGKTTVDTFIEKLTYDDQRNKFLLNGGIDLGVIYSISPAINFELAYQLNKLFSDGVFINNGINASQQNTFSLMLSYRLQK